MPTDLTRRSAFTLMLLVLLVVMEGDPIPSQPPTPERRGTRFPASRAVWQGDVWMTWDTPIQTWFVRSAIAGYREGYGDGCRDVLLAMKRARADHPQVAETDACPTRDNLRNEAIPYSIQITEFYSRYPQDRDVPLDYVIQSLIGKDAKTLEEIHLGLSRIDCSTKPGWLPKPGC